MAPPLPPSAFLSELQIRAALVSMPDADLIRVRQIARLRAAGLISIDWEDLVNEAIARILEGTRVWPKDVPAVAFLAQVIRSIASEERRRVVREPVDLDSDLRGGDDDAPSAVESAANDIDPQREIMARKALLAVEDLFANDREALAILQGAAVGLAPEEIRALADLNLVQYSSAQRRIQRTLARADLI